MEKFTVVFSDQVGTYLRDLEDPDDKERFRHCLGEAVNALSCLKPTHAPGVTKNPYRDEYYYRIGFQDFYEFIMRFILKEDQEALAFNLHNDDGPITKIVIIETLRVKTL